MKTNFKFMMTVYAFCVSVLTSEAQNLGSFQQGKYAFYDNEHWGFSLMLSHIANPGLPFSKAHNLTAISLKIDWKNYYLGKGKRRFYWQNKVIGDAISTLGRLIINPNQNINNREETTLTHLLGFGSWAWNVTDAQRNNIAIGFNINDFIVGSRVYDRDPQGRLIDGRINEPHGLYYAAGPSVFFDFAINDNWIIQSLATYSFNMFRLVAVQNEVKDNKYPRPAIAEISFELLSRTKLTAGIDYTWIIDRGPNNNQARRLDFMLGYRF